MVPNPHAPGGHHPTGCLPNHRGGVRLQDLTRQLRNPLAGQSRDGQCNWVTVPQGQRGTRGPCHRGVTSGWTLAKGGQPAQRLNSPRRKQDGGNGGCCIKAHRLQASTRGCFQGIFRCRFSSKMSSGNNETQTLLTQGNTSTSGQSLGLEATVLGSKLGRSLHHLRVFPAQLLAS